MHVLAPAPAYAEEPQGTQVDAPTIAEKELFKHGMHAAAVPPSQLGLYVPGSQYCTSDEPSGQN
jgi:hypothetical protein